VLYFLQLSLVVFKLSLVVLLLMRCKFLACAGLFSADTSEHVFKAMIQSLLPADISHLEGTGLKLPIQI